MIMSMLVFTYKQGMIMNRIKLSAISTATLLVLSTVTFAAPLSVSHQGGWYAGITAGSGVIETHEKNGSNTRSDEAYNLTNRSAIGGVHVGYNWQLSPRWLLGFESGYQYLGHSNALQHVSLNSRLRNDTIIRAVDALFTGQYFLSNQVNVFGKLGAAYETLTRTSDCEQGTCLVNTIDVSGHSQTTQYHINPEIQLGLGWHVSKALRLSAAYQRIIGDNVRQYNTQTLRADTYINPSINSFLFGLDYYFMVNPGLHQVNHTSQGGWYAGITAGSGVIETHEKDDSNNDNEGMYNLTNRSAVGGVHVGYNWQLNSRWLMGLEGGYQYLGHSEALQHRPFDSRLRSGTTIRAVDALFTGQYSLSNQVDVFGKLGAAYETLTRTSDCEQGACNVNTIAASNHNQTTQYHINPEIQLGLGWHVSKALRLSAAYQRVMSDNVRQYNTQTHAYDTNIDPSINSFLFGLDYYFMTNAGLHQVTHTPHRGWYTGITAGSGVIETKETDGSNNISDWALNLTNRTAVGGVHVGYNWQLSPRWLMGLEGGYQYLGHSEALQHVHLGSRLRSGTTIRAVDALFTGEYFLSNQVDVFGKLGAAYETLTRTSDCEQGTCLVNTIDVSGHSQTTQYHINPEIQLGLGWHLNKTLRLSAAYQRIMSDNVRQTNGQIDFDDTHINPSINSFLVGLDYYFMANAGLRQVIHASHGGWYAGITAGSGVIETYEADGSVNDNERAYNLTNRSAVGGVHVGYNWQLSSRWLMGLEGGYQYLGHSEALQHVMLNSTLRSGTTIRAIDALFTGQYFLSNQVDVFGKLGATYETLTRTSDCEQGACFGPSIAASGHNQTTQYHINPEFQLGLGWHVSKALQLSAAYQRVISDNVRQYSGQTFFDDTRINPSINSIILGLDYYFATNPGLRQVIDAPQGGWYAGITAGSGVIETHEHDGSNNNSAEAFNLTNRSATGGVHVGYNWQLSSRWLMGFESGYQYVGHSETLQHVFLGSRLRGGTTIRAVDALFTGQYFLSNQVDVFSKLGAAYETLTHTSDCEQGTCEPSTIAASGHNQTTQYHINPEIQLGLGWHVNKVLRLSVAYQRIMSDNVRQNSGQIDADNTYINPSINSILLGLDYKF